MRLLAGRAGEWVQPCVRKTTTVGAFRGQTRPQRGVCGPGRRNVRPSPRSIMERVLMLMRTTTISLLQWETAIFSESDDSIFVPLYTFSGRLSVRWFPASVVACSTCFSRSLTLAATWKRKTIGSPDADFVSTGRATLFQLDCDAPSICQLCNAPFLRETSAVSPKTSFSSSSTNRGKRCSARKRGKAEHLTNFLCISILRWCYIFSIDVYIYTVSERICQ